MQTCESTLSLQLKALKLSGFNDHWKEIAQKAMNEQWAYADYLAYLCQEELQRRENNRLKNRLRLSKLPANKTLTCFNFKELPKTDTANIKRLAESDHWLKQAHNIILFGPSGIGKTHVSAAIGYRQIELGHCVRFFQTSHLVQLLQRAKVQFQLKELLIKLDKVDLLILDDFGYVKKDEHETSVLFELISHRYETGSLLITANQPFSQWDAIFADNMMAVASVDRLVHHAQIINMKGESYRRKNKTQK